MTANQYRSALDKLGLTQAGAAEFLGVSIRTVAHLINARDRCGINRGIGIAG